MDNLAPITTDPAVPTKKYVDDLAKPEVFTQPGTPGAGATSLLWVDIDDTSLAGSVVTVAWLRWTGTQAQYDAIVTKDPNTLYVIV